MLNYQRSIMRDQILSTRSSKLGRCTWKRRQFIGALSRRYTNWYQLSHVWSKLADEIVEKILVLPVRNSDEATFTFNKLSLTCFPSPASMYRIRNFYWQSVKSGATNPIVIVDPNDNNCNDNTTSICNEKECWIRNELFKEGRYWHFAFPKRLGKRPYKGWSAKANV